MAIALTIIAMVVVAVAIVLPLNKAMEMFQNHIAKTQPERYRK